MKLLLLALAGCLTSCGSPFGCTDVGCFNGFNLVFRNADRTGLDSGSYQLTVDFDGTSAGCTVTMASGTLSTFCPDLSVTASAPPLSFFVLTQGEPESATFTLSRDGTEIASDSVELDYEEVKANRDMCGTACSTATADVTLQ